MSVLNHNATKISSSTIFCSICSERIEKFDTNVILGNSGERLHYECATQYLARVNVKMPRNHPNFKRTKDWQAWFDAQLRIAVIQLEEAPWPNGSMQLCAFADLFGYLNWYEIDIMAIVNQELRNKVYFKL